MRRDIVWLSTRGRAIVRMKVAGVDITLERVNGGRPGAPHFEGPNWQVMDVSFNSDEAPFGGSIFRVKGDGFAMCNHTSLIKAAEDAYQATPDGAQQINLTKRAPA